MESWTAQQIKVFLSVSSRLTVDVEVLDIFNSFPFYFLNRRFCEIFAEQLIWRTPRKDWIWHYYICFCPNTINLILNNKTLSGIKRGDHKIWGDY